MPPDPMPDPPRPHPGRPPPEKRRNLRPTLKIPRQPPEERSAGWSIPVAVVSDASRRAGSQGPALSRYQDPRRSADVPSTRGGRTPRPASLKPPTPAPASPPQTASFHILRPHPKDPPWIVRKIECRAVDTGGCSINLIEKGRSARIGPFSFGPSSSSGVSLGYNQAMIQRLGLREFKAWPVLEPIDMGPITGFFGANSAGKSSIFQALLLLKQTAESPDRLQVLNFGREQDYVELGSFLDVASGHRKGATIEFDLSWSLDKPISLAFEGGKTVSGASVGLKVQVARATAGQIYVQGFEYRFGEATFGLQRLSAGRYRLNFSPESVGLRKGQGRPIEYVEPIKCYGFPDALRASYMNGERLSDLQLAFETMLGRLYYLGPLRERPRRQYAYAGTTPSDVGSRGEWVVDALLAARQQDRKFSRGQGVPRYTFEEQIAYWLKELGLIASFRVAPVAPDSNLYQVLVRQSEGGSEVALTDVGFGVSQVLPVLTLLYYVPKGSTVLLEHPEIHLHPRVQSGLADVIIHASKTRRVQVLIESHSEHLLRRLQRRIAEETLKADDVALYFVTVREGRSVCETLDVDEYGNIRNWPPEFFGDEFGEIAAQQKAAVRRIRAKAA